MSNTEGNRWEAGAAFREVSLVVVRVLRKRRVFLAAVLAAALIVLLVMIPFVRRTWWQRQAVQCLAALSMLQNVVTTYPTVPPSSPEETIRQAVDRGILRLDQTVCPACGKPYIFVPPLPSASTKPGITLNPRVVVAYEPLSNHHEEGATILFADGHADFVTAREYRKLIPEAADAH